MGQDYQIITEQVITSNIYGGVIQNSVSVATAISTTIPIGGNGRILRVSATAATTSGSCTLGVGILDGQQITLCNESANNIVISGNMKGAAAATVSGSQAATFTWIATSTAWFPTKG